MSYGDNIVMGLHNESYVNMIKEINNKDSDPYNHRSYMYNVGVFDILYQKICPTIHLLI